MENGIMKRNTLFLSALCILATAVIASPLTAQSSRSRSRSSGKAAEWNQWCGPNRDNISTETGLLKQWPAGGPPLAWKATGLGKGQSSVCVAGKVYELASQKGLGREIPTEWLLQDIRD